MGEESDTRARPVSTAGKPRQSSPAGPPARGPVSVAGRRASLCRPMTDASARPPAETATRTRPGHAGRRRRGPAVGRLLRPLVRRGRALASRRPGRRAPAGRSSRPLFSPGPPGSAVDGRSSAARPRSPSLGSLALVLALAFFFRLPVVVGGAGAAVTSDGALSGIVALHVADGSARRVFVPQVPYSGSLKSHLTAPSRAGDRPRPRLRPRLRALLPRPTWPGSSASPSSSRGRGPRSSPGSTPPSARPSSPGTA